MQDEDVRTSCFAQLAVLCAEYGEEVPYRGGLDRKFVFRGQRVPYLNQQKGIYRSAAQRGPAALSVQTSAKSPYRDVETPDGFLYDYRAGGVDQPDNRALRAAHEPPGATRLLRRNATWLVPPELPVPRHPG